MRLRPALLALLILIAAPLAADERPDSGAYLATVAAVTAADFEAVALYGTEALALDPTNSQLRFSVAEAQLMLGDLAAAKAVMLDHSSNLAVPNRLRAMIEIGVMTEAEEWTALTELIRSGKGVGPLVDELVLGWAAFGADQLGPALAAFDLLVAQGGETRAFGLYHRALLLGLIGDLEGAEEALKAGGATALGEASVAFHAELLFRLQRDDEATTLITRLDPKGDAADLVHLLERNRQGLPPSSYGVTDASEGIARAFLMLALFLDEEGEAPEVLRFARMAEIIDPSLVPAHLTVAQLAEQLELFDIAIDAYGRVAADSPQRPSATLRRSRLMALEGNHVAALAAIERLSEEPRVRPDVLMALGDQLRRMDRFGEAAAAYDRAITAHGDAAPWALFFARGIAHERLGNWPASEADLRAALALNPNEPRLLNYLGYSLVENGQNLDEALAMIERAVAREPQNGAIVDSLGWVLYRLGRYAEAVIQLERAVELEPVDPVINDHLGDALWKVDRVREAQFQWRRALSLTPGPEEAERIRQKIDHGLDGADDTPDRLE